jgi:hypothetical protein
MHAQITLASNFVELIKPDRPKRAGNAAQAAANALHWGYSHGIIFVSVYCLSRANGCTIAFFAMPAVQRVSKAFVDKLDVHIRCAGVFALAGYLAGPTVDASA